MDTLNRAVRNSVFQLGSQLVTWSATLLLTAALGRYLGDSGLGILFLALTFTAFFGVLPLFGLQNLVTREVARDPKLVSQYLVYGMLITLGLWVISYVAIEVSAIALGYSSTVRFVFRIYALTMGMQAAFSLLGAVYRGLERMGPPAMATVIERVLNMALGLFLLARGAGVTAMAWVLLIGAAANVLWQLWGLRHYLRLDGAFDGGFARRLVVGAVPFAAYWAVWALYWKIDILMLSKMTDEAVIGWYAAGYRLFETLLFLPNVIAISVMLPILSRLSQRSQPAMQRAFEKGFNLLVVVGLPICAGMIVLARPVMTFIYHRPEFLEAAPVLQVLGIGLFVMYVNAAMNWALVSLDMERKFMLIPLAALALNVVLNLVMIPLWRHVGAAASTVICEVLIGAFYLVIMPKWLLSSRMVRVLALSALASAGMSVVLIGASHLYLPLLMALGAAVYGLLILVLRVLPGEDLQVLRRAITRRRAASPADGAEAA